jgi:hypothetical protein
MATEDAVGTLGVIGTELASALQPLEDHLTADGIVSLFVELGIRLPPEIIGKTGFSPALTAGRDAVLKLPDLVAALAAATGLDAILAATQELVKALVAIFKAIDALADVIKKLSNELPGVTSGDVEAFAEVFAQRLLESLVVIYLEGSFPRLTAFLALLGIVEIAPSPPEQVDATHPAYLRRALHFDNVPKVLKSIDAFMRDEYKWGADDFDGRLLLSRTHDLLYAFAVPAKYVAGAGAKPPALEVLLFSLTPVAADASVTPPAPPGLRAQLRFGLQESFTVSFPFFVDGWSIDVATKGKLEAGLTADLRPPGSLSVKAPTGTLDGSVSLGVVGARPDAGHPDPFRVLRIPGIGRIDAGRVRASVGAEYHLGPGGGSSAGDPVVELRLEKGELTFGADPNDGFLGRIIPAGSASFDVGVGWSRTRGVFFTGAGGLAIVVPINRQVGPLRVDSLNLGVKVDGAALALETSVTGAAALGPVQVSVANVGLESRLKFERGNLGPFDLGLGFKFPSGVGISVNAGPVSGGGFLFFDPDNGRYFGAVELSIYSVAVKAFGLIETKFPDGHKGFSFVVIISAEFTPIQLGLGFTLNGVGGLLGINRTLAEDGLRDAVKHGSLDHVLFPRDVVRDAPALVHDLGAIFPPAEGVFTFGPLAKIGWGTPTLIEAKLGIILVLPELRLALLGNVQAVLPKREPKEARLVELNMDIAGVLDFPRKHFALDASLHDSKVAGYTLSGDMAMRLDWGQSPNFALAVGGFHPHYNPPAGFPKLRPMAIDLGISGNPSATVMGYMAVTSNTAQVGAKLDVRASAAGASLRGFIGFDALVVFSPFSFEASLEGGVSVDFHGHGFSLHFKGDLSGPAPWRIRGEVCVSILWWDACVGFSITLGSEKRVELPAVDPWLGLDPTETSLEKQEIPGLRSAIASPSHWTAVLPAGAHTVVTLREPGPGESAPVDPVGVVTFRQKVAPLAFPLTKFAGRALDAERRITIDSVKTPSGAALDRVDVEDLFAPGQYRKMKDAEALSSQSFQSLRAGVSVSTDRIVAGAASDIAAITYETFVVDRDGNDVPKPAAEPAYVVSDTHLAAMSERSAGAEAGVRGGGERRFLVPGLVPKVSRNPELYLIARRDTLKPAPELPLGQSVARAIAAAALDGAVAGNAAAKRVYQVIPVGEAA